MHIDITKPYNDQEVQVEQSEKVNLSKQLEVLKIEIAKIQEENDKRVMILVKVHLKELTDIKQENDALKQELLDSKELFNVTLGAQSKELEKVKSTDVKLESSNILLFNENKALTVKNVFLEDTIILKKNEINNIKIHMETAIETNKALEDEAKKANEVFLLKCKTINDNHEKVRKAYGTVRNHIVMCNKCCQ